MSKLEHAISFSLLPDELIVDNFAGGGGASLGIEMALGRSPDIAINHDSEAIAMHKANHPDTHHFCEDVWEVNPKEACGGRQVGLAWFSPDCKHFSKAKGGKPVSKKIRGLAWIVVKWAKAVQPRVIILENVEEFQDWGPLDDENRPCPKRKGKTFQRWLAQLRNLEYVVEWRELRACDYSTPTIRKRLFIVARRDGQKIVWPEPTHASPKKIGTDLFTSHLKPWRTAAECIDWSIPCPSIFDRHRPLAENTLRRVAAGLRRFVIESPEPFIVSLTHHGGDRVEPLGEPFKTVTGANRGEKALVQPFIVNMAHRGKLEAMNHPISTIATEKGGCRALVTPFITKFRTGSVGSGLDEPLHTVTAGGEMKRPAGSPHAMGLISPTLIQTGYGERPALFRCIPCDEAFTDEHASQVGGLAPAECPICGEEERIEMLREAQAPRAPGLDKPLGTVVAGGSKHALVAAFLAQHNGTSIASDVFAPVPTLVGKAKHSVITSNLVKLRGTCRHGQSVDEPMATVSAQGLHLAEVRAFLIAYYGNERDGASLHEPMRTTTSKERFGLVTIHGEEYVIADIGLRMLTPRELYRAQGFHDEYIIDPVVDGKPLSKTAQVRMCGNSVCPPNAAAMVRAQFGMPTLEMAA